MFEENSLVGQMAKGKYPTKVVTTKYGDFTLKYPSGQDRMLIERKKADLLGGRSMDQFGGVHLTSIERDMTLSVVISSYPDKLPEPFKGDNLIDFPDLEVKNSLYKEFGTFFLGVQNKISGKS